MITVLMGGKKEGIDSESSQLAWADPTLCIHNSLKDLTRLGTYFLVIQAWDGYHCLSGQE